MNQAQLLRQSDIVDTKSLDIPITLVGAGAIGSFTALLLSKMGYDGMIHVCDPDTIEEHNLSNQFYPLRDEGKRKVHALAKVVHDYSGVRIDPDERRLDSCPITAGALILAVDSMDTRITLWKSALNLSRSMDWVFDARMGAELMRVYTVNMQSEKERDHYAKSLYPSSEAQQLPCTARSVIYNVAVVAGLLTNQIKRAMMGEKYKREIIFDLKTMTLLTQ